MTKNSVIKVKNVLHQNTVHFSIFYRRPKIIYLKKKTGIDNPPYSIPFIVNKISKMLNPKTNNDHKLRLVSMLKSRWLFYPVLTVINSADDKYKTVTECTQSQRINAVMIIE